MTANSRLISHDDGGADGDAIIEIGHVFVGHAKASGGYRLTDGLRLVRSVNAVERRSQIERAGAERVLDAARQMARQIGPPRQHLPGRRPTRPFFFGGNAMHPAPAKAVATDAN